jgi:carbon-monoxide dehydrogenase small subunit
VLAIHQLLERYESPSDEEIAHALLGNVCRCSGYVNIFKAVRELAGARAGVAAAAR